MSRTLIGRTVERLRTERGLSQQALATRLGISASYLNLIEHDQRAVTASLLIKLGETLARRPGRTVRHPGTPVGGRAARSLRRPAAGRRRRGRSRGRSAGRRQPERRPRRAGAVSGMAGGAGGCQRHRAAVRPPHPAAERGSAGLLRRPRQPFSGAGRSRRNAWHPNWLRACRPK